MLSTKRRTKLDLPTEKEPSMQTFFWSMPMSRSVRGSSAGAFRGGRRGEGDLECYAAIEPAALFRAFITQRLRSADAARQHAGRFDAVAQQGRANLIGALAAERKIGSFDASDIGMSDQIDSDGLV